MTSDSANWTVLDNTSILNVSATKKVFINAINRSADDQVAEFDDIVSVHHNHIINFDLKKLNFYVNDVIEQMLASLFAILNLLCCKQQTFQNFI